MAARCCCTTTDLRQAGGGGGLPTAEIADRIGLTSRDVGAFGTGKGPEGCYILGPIVRFVEKEGAPGCLVNQVVAAGDEAADSHRLLPTFAEEIRRLGGIPVTYAFMAREADPKIMPDIYAETCSGPPLKPYWKTQQREPGVAEILERVHRLDVTFSAMLAIGSLTAAAETAKAIKTIDGLCTGALPYDEYGGIDTSWLELGNCGGRNVMVFGKPNVDLLHAAQLVVEANGTPHIFYLT